MPKLVEFKLVRADCSRRYVLLALYRVQHACSHTTCTITSITFEFLCKVLAQKVYTACTRCLHACRLGPKSFTIDSFVSSLFYFREFTAMTIYCHNSSQCSQVCLLFYFRCHHWCLVLKLRFSLTKLHVPISLRIKLQTLKCVAKSLIYT